MSTPQSTPIRQVKLGIVSAKSLPLTNEYKKLLSDQHQRLALKHQQDLDLLDDIRGYVKARLSIEKDYTNALQKLAKHHSNHISKKFALLSQLDHHQAQTGEQQKAQILLQNSNDGDLGANNNTTTNNNNKGSSSSSAAAAANQELERQASQNTTASTTGDNQQQSNNGSGSSSSKKPSSLYKVWYEHISRLQSTSRNRSDQFEQLIIIVDKLKDIRQHKASIGKKCLESHLRRIQEDLLLSMMDVERAKKLYYEDESQAKKARENEERIKKKRTGLLTKFTDLQAKKERSSAQREATDIQSTQARNDYIMALAAANAHLQHYYQRDLNDFIHLIDDGVLNHCKIFMATLSECDINSLKDALQHAQHWSRLINMTGLQQTNCIFLKCDQSKCLRTKQELAFEACNNDPIQKISLEHNADYALQHEIDKWFTWFKKECRNLGQLMHQLDSCQHAFAEGKKAVEVNGQTIEDLEPKIIELKQQIRKCEAAKLKAQARLRAIKEGGMQIEEWSDVELEIRADMARAQEEQQRALRLKETKEKSMDEASLMQEPCGQAGDQPSGRTAAPAAAGTAVQLQISRDSDDEDDVTQPAGESMHNLASVSRSTSNLAQKQQVAMTGYSALTDPSLVWQDEYSSAWGDSGALAAGSQQGSVVASNSFHGGRQPQPQQNPSTSVRSPTSPRPTGDGFGVSSGDDPLGANCRQPGPNQDKQKQQIPQANMSIQSSSPLSAIVNGGQHLSQSPYQAGIMSEAYKSDYECDYARTGHHASMRSAASSAEPGNLVQARPTLISSQANEFGYGGGGPADEAAPAFETPPQQQQQQQQQQMDVNKLLNRRVVAQYAFEKNNEDDLAFNENDVLVVIETNPADTNWIKARLESTGEEGFVPSSYVRPIEGEDEGQQQRSEVDAWQSVDQQESTANGSASGGGGGGAQQDEHSAGTLCRALYDYAPERDTFEDDGLPHLALKQGELMRVIDQGADDGWWLVEKGEGGLRGHVPSMLVEASDPNQDDGDPLDDEDDDDDDEEFDDGDVSDREAHDDDDDKSASKGPPPSFEAPVLQVTETVTKQADASEGEPLEQRLEFDSHDQEEPQQQEAAKLADSTKKAASASDSLIPTAFIIIEPTPEVESRRFEDSLREGAQAKGADENNNNDDSSNNNINDDHHDVRGQEARSAQETPTTNDGENNEGFGAAICEGGASEAERQTTRQQIVLAGKQPPSSQVSYSVVNEDFVLEKPIRKPYQHSAGSIDNPAGHHHEPTIEEVDDRLEREEIAEGYDCSDNGRLSQEDKHNEPPADLGHERPAPPSVVIDSVEAIPRSPDLSFDENASGQGDEQDASSSYSAGAANGDPDTSQHSDAGSEPAKRAIKHSGYVDVSPILRHHAEEFCKQLIEEAILLAPGSRIGPSTSSASVTDDHRNFGDDDEQEEGPDGDYQRNYSFEDST